MRTSQCTPLLLTPALTLSEVLRHIFAINRFQRVKLGIDRVHELHRALGAPFDGMRIVHVGGSNGKGSVCWKTWQELRRAGYRTGLFVSPHVSSFRERMRVDDELVSEQETVELYDRVTAAAATQEVRPSFFEVVTMMSALHFAEKAVDAIVLEVGLGGRLDATNVVTPAVSVITSIGLEHTSILGSTVEAIAQEKAGIIKPGAPVVVGPTVPLSVVRPIAQSLHAPLHVVQRTGAVDFAWENSMIAAAALEVLRQRSDFALPPPSTQRLYHDCPPCRFEAFRVAPRVTPGHAATDVLVVLDAAHNPPAMRSLVERARRELVGTDVFLVAGFSADKDLPSCAAELRALVPPERVITVAANHPRAASAREVAQLFSDPHAPASRTPTPAASVAEGVQQALAAASARGDWRSLAWSPADKVALPDHMRPHGRRSVVLVCGSLYIMAEARQALGICEPTDPPGVNEGHEHARQEWR